MSFVVLKFLVGRTDNQENNYQGCYGGNRWSVKEVYQLC